tara:strand:- start:1270 stop:2055 length:786 start_codon:yes stop_codon:yes gene_type:complete
MRYIYIVIISGFIFCQDEYIVTIPATSYSDWIYYSLSSHSVIPVDYPENSLEWDLAFQRKHIKTNSGLSGPGFGGAIVDSVGTLDSGSFTWTDEWANINDIPEYEYELVWLEDTTHYDFYDLSTHTYVEGIKNPALNSWGWFDDSYVLNPTNYVMFVRAANGEDVIKFWAYDYYDNGYGGNISIRYQVGLSDSSCDYDSGDINSDSIINVVDVVIIVNAILDNNLMDSFSSCQITLGDLNSDGVINVVDIIGIVNIILNNN